VPVDRGRVPKARRIRAELQSAGRGGHAVVLGDDVVAALGLKQHTRVKGTIGGIPYRSSTARYGGAMYLGVYKATVARAGIAAGRRRVERTIDALLHRGGA
jgi:Domain of unknown function (DUF1905)